LKWFLKLSIKFILASSTNSSNDILEGIAIVQILVRFSGSENDVVLRFIEAAEGNNLEFVICLFN
jgi:spore coat polysaccharide biosynthesis protein SpsF (cytidylyltransferase family)